MIRIQEETFSLDEEVNRLVEGNPKVGGIVGFLGTVRDFTETSGVTALILEHYPGMTESELEKIESAAKARFDVESLLVVHRVGRLSVGENIVLVVAAAAHRSEAFDACRYVIDHLKVHATFWKKEVIADGVERWIHACPGCEAAATQWDDLKKSTPCGHTEDPPEKVQGHTHGEGHGHGQSHTHGEGHGVGHGHGHASSWSGLQVGVLTLSDSRNQTTDKSGDALIGLVLGWGGKVLAREIVPDDQQTIQDTLIQWADEKKLDLIITNGGTGPGPRDVTPEATRHVCNRELPGFAELIRSEGLKQTRNALFTRGVAAVRGVTLVVNVPGSTRGAVHSLSAVADLIPHALRMVRGGGH